ncbi:hypothetical protein ACP70R_046399 [Stipagrostis hirtigluma subsp. patula]
MPSSPTLSAPTPFAPTPSAPYSICLDSGPPHANASPSSPIANLSHLDTIGPDARPISDRR